MFLTWGGSYKPIALFDSIAIDGPAPTTILGHIQFGQIVPLSEVNSTSAPRVDVKFFVGLGNFTTLGGRIYTPPPVSWLFDTNKYIQVAVFDRSVLLFVATTAFCSAA